MACAILAMGMAPAFADATAFLSDQKGDLKLDGGARPPLLAELLPGSRLDLAAGAMAAVMYIVSGEEYQLKGPGEFVVGRDSVTARKGAAPSRRQPAIKPDGGAVIRVSRAASASLRLRSTASAPAAAAIHPQGRIVDPSPVVRYPGTESKATVTVMAIGGTERFRGDLKSGARLPVRLEPGQSYAWTVRAGDRELAHGQFEVLPAADVDAAEKARRAARSFGDRVRWALLLESLGAPADAREAWSALAAERPDLPELSLLAR
jgi:hypothetical protein